MPQPPDFDGETYERDRDHERLTSQLGRVRSLMADGHWRALPEIALGTGDPEASISARLRDLRKTKFGGLRVERRYVEEGLWEYRVSPLDTLDVPVPQAAPPPPPPARPSRWVCTSCQQPASVDPTVSLVPNIAIGKCLVCKKDSTFRRVGA